MLTQNVKDSKIAFDVYRRYGTDAEKQEIETVNDIFRKSDQIGDAFHSRVAIVATWINTTYGITDDNRKKEVSQF